MATQETDNAKLFGIGKQMDKELNELPTIEHSALMTMLNAMLQKRVMCEQRAQHEQQLQAQREDRFGAGASGIAVIPRV